MKTVYHKWSYQVYSTETLRELVRIAKAEPEVLLGYYNLEETDNLALGKYIAYSILVPEDLLSKYENDLHDLDWFDSDSYKLDNEPWRYALKSSLLEDMERLLEISDEIETIRKRYVGCKATEEAHQTAEKSGEPISPGPHWLSGIDTFHLEADYENTCSDQDGYAVVIDGVTYLALEDHADGYRSYAVIRQLAEGEKVDVVNQFEPQLVYAHVVKRSDSENFQDIKGIEFRNSYGQVVLEIVTDYYDNWYPCGHVGYYPQNLPCNTVPQPN